MGAFLSRRANGVEEVEISTSHAYRYPPKSGCYFGSHFIMGGEKFETTQPECYLFGENSDLNFLGNRPAPFPYPAPQAHEPTKTLKSLVNIRKDSIRFIKVMEQENTDVNEESGEREHDNTPHKYNIEFTFDTDVRIAITVYYFATEEISNGQAIYHPRDGAMNSETYHFKRGANQTFSQSTHIVDPAKFSDEEWQYNPDKEVIPIVIQCVVEEEQYAGHSHASYATVEKSADGGYVLKALKQKQMVDGLYYLLQEIYGIENKSPERQKLDEDLDDNGSECVICMCETRDTLILPCRHLCLCNFCADNLRYQANNCPICRAPFRALLQIRAMQKKAASPPPAQQVDDDTAVSQEGVPSGYEAVPLIEALNGPQNQSNNQPIIPPFSHALPPDDSTGNSPVLKRKHRRSSARASRHSRRAHAPRDEQKTVTSPTQVPTDGAVAMAAITTAGKTTLKPEVENLVKDTASPEGDNISVKLDLESDVAGAVAPTDESEADKCDVIQRDVTEETNQIASDINIADEASGDIVTGCTDDEQDENEAVEQTPLCADVTDARYVTAQNLNTQLSESRLKSRADNLDFTDSPLKPSADSSGSSYSSTSSSKGLLDNIPPVVELRPRPED